MISLAAFAAEIRKEAKAAGMEVLPGTLLVEPSPFLVEISPSAERPVDLFMTMAKLARAGALLIQEEKLSQEDCDLVDGDTAAFAKHVGQVHAVTLLAVPQGLKPIVSLRLVAPWSRELFGDEGDDDHGAAKPLTNEEQAWVHRLATDPLFPDADYRLRQKLLERIAPGISNFERILAEADLHWQLDLKPARDSDLRSKALDLIDQGIPRTKIVIQLGMKNTHALKKLLGEA